MILLLYVQWPTLFLTIKVAYFVPGGLTPPPPPDWGRPFWMPPYQLKWSYYIRFKEPQGHLVMNISVFALLIIHGNLKGRFRIFVNIRFCPFKYPWKFKSKYPEVP